MITTVVAVLALCTSLLLLGVHYRNQIERRHGEIARLRADFMKRVATLHQRMIAIQAHHQTVRLEIRRAPDSDAKYEMIETMPLTLAGIASMLASLRTVEKGMASIDTAEANTTSFLVNLQKLDSDLDELERKMTLTEQLALDLLSNTAQLVEMGDGQPSAGPAAAGRAGDV